MKFKYHGYYPIVDFINIDSGTLEIFEFINQINDALEQDERKKLFPDWTVRFYFIYTKSLGITISKKGSIYKDEKLRDYNITIPIPNDKEIRWGIRRGKFGYDTSNMSYDERYWIKIPANYNDFANMKDFVIHCAKEAIVALLKYGITIEGQKIKFEDIESKIVLVSD